MVGLPRSLVLVVVLTLLLGGMSSYVMVDGSTDTPPLPPFIPQIDNQVQEIMTEQYIPSVAVAVVRNDSIIWAKGYGEQSELETIYMTGSVTKTITGTAVFQLYEQGLIELDDDVNNYLPFSLRHPDYNETPITIRMLLLHTSGLAKDTELYIWGMGEDALMRIEIENPFDWLPYPDWIGEHLTPNGSLYVEESWTQHEPGTNRHYSNMGYNVLSYIVNLVAGKPIWEYVQENIFDPLDMDCSGYNFTGFDESQLALPYEYMMEIDPNSTGNKAYPHYNYMGYGSGAVRSNVYDLARYIQIHMHQGESDGVRIIEEDTVTLMHQLQASWVTGDGGLVNWDGWGGTEGDIYGFHAKAYAIIGGNTTVPYAVITLVNQGHDDARGAAYNITRLLQKYVHEFDTMEYSSTSSTTTTTIGVPVEPVLLVGLTAGVGVAMVLLVILMKRRNA